MAGRRRPVVEQLEDRSLLATLGIGPGGLHVAEGGTATLQVSLSQPQMQPTTFTFRTISGTAIGGSDYQEILSGNGTIPPMSSFANISIQALTDSLSEPAETFSVQLLTASGATINPAASSVDVTIDNVESPGGGSGGGSATLSLSTPADVDEGEGFSLTAQLSSPGTYQINATINWGATPGAGPTNFSGMTNPDGSFTIGHQYFDDGPAGGNGTPQDAETITLTGTATKYTMQGPIYIPLSGTVSTTIYNVAPTNVIDIYNSTPLGGPRWVVSGAFQDVGLSDHGTLQIDWGDQSPVYLQSDLLVGDTFTQEHTYPADGQSYTITVTLTDDDTGTVTKTKSFGMYLFDLDNDADNNGAIADDDEELEPSSSIGGEMPTGGSPGRYIAVNYNDDNANGIPDMDENGPIYGENDLEPFEVKWQEALRPEITNYKDWKVTLTVWQVSASSNQLPQIWFTPDKSGAPLVMVPSSTSANSFVGTWIVGLQDPTIPGKRNADELPQTFYLEARSEGEILMKLHLWTPEGTPVASDAVRFTAVVIDSDVNLDIYNGKNGAVVKRIDENTKGAVTVANMNDTDADRRPDYEDIHVLETDGTPRQGSTILPGRNEVDLMRLDLHKPVGYDKLAGIPVTLTVSHSNRIKLWKNPTKEFPINLDGDRIDIMDWDTNEWTTNPTNGTKTIWVEITTPSNVCADLSLTLKYGAKSQSVKATGLWVERTAVAYQDADFIRDFTKWPAPWKNAPNDIYRIVDVASGGPQGNTIGTGVRAKFTNEDGKAEFSNIILFEFQVYPANAQAFFKGVVRFDITRQTAAKEWLVPSVGNPVPTDNEPFPNQWEYANDDEVPGPGFVRDESIEPDVFGKMYSVDAPGLALGPLGIGSTMFRRFNAYEYVRVSLDGTKPDGNGLLGSQCSPNYSWHSRTTVKMQAGGWARENVAGTTKVNDIGLGLITLGDAP